MGNKWGIITVGVLSALMLVAVASLMVFHCYISVCEGTTTFGMIADGRGDREKEREREMPEIHVTEVPPKSTDRIRLRQKISN